MPSPRILSVLLLPAALIAAPREAPAEDPRSLMLQARTLQRKGGGDDPEGAAALYRKVIALVPDSAQAHLRLSESILESGHLEEALEPAERAVELDPRSADAAFNLAIIQYNRSQNFPSLREAASQSLHKAARMLPGDAEVWTLLAEVCESRKDEAGALQAWMHVGRLRPRFNYRDHPLTDWALERVQALAVKRKRYEERREAVMALCDRPYPQERHLKLLEDLARFQVESMYLGHAEESFRLLGRFYSSRPAVWENIAIIQLQTMRFKEALESLKAAESLAPSARTTTNIGLCLMKLGRFKEAESCLAPLLAAPRREDDGGLVDTLRLLYATDLFLLDRSREAGALIRTWEGWERHEDLMALAAQAHIQAEEWKEARALLRDGMARFPDEDLFKRTAQIPKALFEEGRTFHKDVRQSLAGIDHILMASLWNQFRQWENCIAEIAKARKASPTAAVELLLLESTAQEELGRSREAIATLRQAQKLEPGNPLVQNNLGYTLLEKGEGSLDEAAQLIQLALKSDPANGSTLDSWGWLLYKRGDHAEAEVALAKAVELRPYSPEIRQHLGEVLVKLKRYEEAIEQWEKVLAYATTDRKAMEDRLRDLRILFARQKGEGDEDALPLDDDEPDEEE